MNHMHSFFKGLFFVSIISFMGACQQPGENQTGSEFIPDMVHGLAIEGNVYSDYTLNKYDKSVLDYRVASTPGLPVDGTVPRGYAGLSLKGDAAAVMALMNGQTSYNAIRMTANGHVPYYYADTEADRDRSNAEIVGAPFPITKAGLEKGKALYDIFCGICHGETGNGLGYLVRDDGGKYPAAPANFLQDTFYQSNNGRLYHAIMYGKNVMGGYADKLNFEERWHVVHYIRSLQAKEKKLEYSENANTLNPAWGVPLAKAQMAQSETLDVLETPEAPETAQKGGGSK